MDQRLVTDLMAERVIEALEIVEVDVSNRQRRPAPSCASQLTLAGLVEPTAVERTGQWVSHRGFARFGQCFLEFGDTQGSCEHAELAEINCIKIKIRTRQTKSRGLADTSAASGHGQSRPTMQTTRCQSVRSSGLWIVMVHCVRFRSCLHRQPVLDESIYGRKAEILSPTLRIICKPLLQNELIIIANKGNGQPDRAWTAQSAHCDQASRAKSITIAPGSRWT
jgi:hypothetical protein